MVRGAKILKVYSQLPFRACSVSEFIKRVLHNFSRQSMTLREGNVFSRVCHFVNRGALVAIIIGLH